MPQREPDGLDDLIAVLKRALRPAPAPAVPREGYGLATAEAISPSAKSAYERTLSPGEWESLTQQERNERLATLAGEAALGLSAASPAGRAAVGEVAAPQSEGGKVRPSQRPGYRAKPAPTDFAAKNMESLSPESRAALRDRASDSELRYELAGLTRKDAQLRAKLAERGIPKQDEASDALLQRLGLMKPRDEVKYTVPRGPAVDAAEAVAREAAQIQMRQLQGTATAEDAARLKELLAQRGGNAPAEQFTVEPPPLRDDSKPEFTVEQPAPRSDSKPSFTVAQRKDRDTTLDALLQRLGLMTRKR